MAGFVPEAQAIMKERFGKDSLLALATAADNIPSVRTVNAWYEDGAFYIITWALSGKMQQIARNPVVAISGEWFTAQGLGENLGWFGKPENAAVAGKLKQAFASWIDNGHNNFADENTIILKIQLTHGVLFSHGTRYDIDFE
ncbi:MAG: pyridoxamine 5'-phosphate oxidase family protein [Clostridia bacterium]|nr:pyridoxamine 5'-phosphate oxidase family protein [Clostridia bacterium]